MKTTCTSKGAEWHSVHGIPVAFRKKDIPNIVSALVEHIGDTHVPSAWLIHERSRYWSAYKSLLALSDSTDSETAEEAEKALVSLRAMQREREFTELERWAVGAQSVILAGLELVTDGQLRQWAGVRAVIESCPLTDEEIERIAAADMVEEQADG